MSPSTALLLAASVVARSAPDTGPATPRATASATVTVVRAERIIDAPKAGGVQRHVRVAGGTATIDFY